MTQYQRYREYYREYQRAYYLQWGDVIYARRRAYFAAYARAHRARINANDRASYARRRQRRESRTS